MTLKEVHENLCSKDMRNPSWRDLYGHEDVVDIPKPRENCTCDNCFYGRDKLALEIIRLQTQMEDHGNAILRSGKGGSMHY